MRAGRFSDNLSRRAPTIVIAALCLALLGDWIEAPVLLATGFAVIVAGLALVLFAAKRRGQFGNPNEGEPSSGSDWITNELAGRGSPAGSYVLGFFSILTIVLTGVQSPYAMLAWSALLLTIVWALVNARYPAEGGTET